MNEDLSRALRQATQLLGEKPQIADIWAREILRVLPEHEEATLVLACALRMQGQVAEARPLFDSLCTSTRAPAQLFQKMGALLTRMSEWETAESCYRQLVRLYSGDPRGWLLLGHTLKTRGKRAECLAAYREAIKRRTDLAEAYWSIANLKTTALGTAEITTIRAQLARTDLALQDRVYFEFALARALEDAGDAAASFAHYAEANAHFRATLSYNADRTHGFIERLKRVFDREMFARMEAAGAPEPDVIFIVGLPRSGSTLLEQMLASHSRVEGTLELPTIAQMARSRGDWDQRSDGSSYPEMLATLPVERFGALGEEYLWRTRVHRKTSRPFFVDKMPNNFLHIGFIHLILPNARIVDVRRHPLACGLSLFKQHFARGMAASYSLEDIGRYYADYVSLMKHMDLVLPGRIHRVFYERMVQDPEGEVRRLLDYCGLTFEETCLKFYANERAVQTASSEQVRQPIFRQGMDHWRQFEPWLGPLRDALGGALAEFNNAGD